MTKLQIANMAMLSAVQKVFVNNRKAWEKIKPIAAEVVILQPLLDVIMANMATQFSSQTGGFTSQKDTAMALMNKLGYTISSRLSSWALKIGNEVALKAVSFTKSYLESGTETEQITRNISIVAVATENLASTVDYKVNAVNTVALQTAIDTAKLLAITRNTMGSTRQVATKNIGATVKKAVDILIVIDPMVENMLEDEDKEFGDIYFVARKVEYHKGGSSKKDDPKPPTEE